MFYLVQVICINSIKLKNLKNLLLTQTDSSFLLEPVAFLLFIFYNPLLYIWLDVTNLTIQNTAKYLIIDVYLRVIFSSVNTGYLIMSGREKQATKFAVIDIVLIQFQLSLSLSFLEWFIWSR